MAKGTINVTFTFESAPFEHAIADISHKLYLASKAHWEAQWFALTGEPWDPWWWR